MGQRGGEQIYLNLLNIDAQNFPKREISDDVDINSDFAEE